VESGLLKPDPAKAKGPRGKGSAELLAKQEKAQEKKEKVLLYAVSRGFILRGWLTTCVGLMQARLKREMKKQEKLMAAQGGGDAAGAATATSEAAAASSASVASGTVSATSKKDENLFKRAGDLLRAGCGAGLLAESSSRSAVAGERNYTKICLSLGSGLSLLLPAATPAQEQRPPPSRPGTGGMVSAGGNRPSSPSSPGREGKSAASTASDGEEDGEGGDPHHAQHHDEEEGDHADHHYDLLMRPQDMARLARSAGNIGIVAIPQTIGELTGLGDHQLQALDQQNAESDSADSSRPNSPTREGSPSMDSVRGGSRKHAGKHKKRSKAGKKGAGGGAASKKASSLVRLGMEARSFEVAVPRGRWTHLALVATAYPQNRLTLYMVGQTHEYCTFLA
jgi:hypothetical protein